MNKTKLQAAQLPAHQVTAGMFMIHFTLGSSKWVEVLDAHNDKGQLLFTVRDNDGLDFQTEHFHRDNIIFTGTRI
jgi:hypothetical protein